MKELLVTVFFVGLVNLNGQNEREVIVPVATSATTQHDGVTLHAHVASIAIKGLAYGADDCTNLLGQWDDTFDVCKLQTPLGTTISLPCSAPLTVDPTFTNNIPNLKSLCTNNITAMKPGYLTDPSKYAVRMTLNGGTLKACTNVKQWISYLETSGGAFMIKFPTGRKAAVLNDDAVMWIYNDPIAPHSSEAKVHFYWYYTMYASQTTCKGIPTAPGKGETIECPSVFEGFLGGSGDVGCSNSNYP